MMKYYSIDKKNVVSDSFSDEVIIINLETGIYYSFSGVGIEIWKLLERQITLGQIVKVITRQYPDKDLTQIKSVVKKSIDGLNNEQLLVIQEFNGNENSQNDIDHIEFSQNKNAIFKEALLECFTDMQDFLLVDPIHEVDYENWPSKKEKNESGAR